MGRQASNQKNSLTLAWPLRNYIRNPNVSTIAAKMAEGAGGIDRKAEERMEFSTSKEVTVHPTFESMSLKGTNLESTQSHHDRAHC